MKRILLFLLTYAISVPLTFFMFNLAAAIAYLPTYGASPWWFVIALPMAYIGDSVLAIVHVWWQDAPWPWQKSAFKDSQDFAEKTGGRRIWEEDWTPYHMKGPDFMD